MIALYFAVVIIGLFLLLVKKTSKSFAVIMGGLTIILMASPRVGYDTENFVKYFELLKTEGMEAVTSGFFSDARLFYSLELVAQKFGISTLYMFKAILFLLCGCLVWKTFGKLSYNPCAWIALWFISSFPSDAIQLRNSIALFLLLVGFYFLTKENNVKNLCCYLLWVTLAALFHPTFAIYYVFLLPKYGGKRICNIIKTVFGVEVLIFVFMFITRVGIDIIAKFGVLLSPISVEKTLAYFAVRTNYGALLPFTLSMGQILLLIFSTKSLEKEARHSLDNKKTELLSLNNLVLCCNLILFSTVFLNFFTLSMFRLTRNITLINLLAFSNYIQKGIDDKYKHLLWYFMVIGLCLFMLVYLNFITGPASDVLFAVWKGKLFFLE